jgi:threonine dehydrogenase-like Zn-dependent dehydrogenase
MRLAKGVLPVPRTAGSIGHEFIGIVEQVGADVQGIHPGELVVAPFIYSAIYPARTA